MPFPTRPEEVGWKSQTTDGIGGLLKDYRFLISAREARDEAKGSPYGLNSWYCDKDNANLCYLYVVTEVPLFGWANPRWVLTINSLNSGAMPVTLYGTYAACKWNEERRQNESDAKKVNYERWATEQHQKVDGQEYEYYSCVRTPK